MALNDLTKWDLVLVDLTPVAGGKNNRLTPGLIISPNAANKHLQTVIIAPVNSSIRGYPSRLTFLEGGTSFLGGGKSLEICFDQMKSINKSRIIKVFGTLNGDDRGRVNTLLAYMFSEP